MSSKRRLASPWAAFLITEPSRLFPLPASNANPSSLFPPCLMDSAFGTQLFSSSSSMTVSQKKLGRETCSASLHWPSCSRASVLWPRSIFSSASLLTSIWIIFQLKNFAPLSSMALSANMTSSENQPLSTRSTRTIKLVILVSSLDKAASRKFISMMSSIFLPSSLNKRQQKRSLLSNFWRKFWFRIQKLLFRKDIELILSMPLLPDCILHSEWDYDALLKLVALSLRSWSILITMPVWNLQPILQQRQSTLIILFLSLVLPH